MGINTPKAGGKRHNNDVQGGRACVNGWMDGWMDECPVSKRKHCSRKCKCNCFAPPSLSARRRQQLLALALAFYTVAVTRPRARRPTDRSYVLYCRHHHSPPPHHREFVTVDASGYDVGEEIGPRRNTTISRPSRANRGFSFFARLHAAWHRSQDDAGRTP